MRVLVLSGSTRRGSLNTRLAHLLASSAVAAGVATNVDVDASLDRLPFYDRDVEDTGVPLVVRDLRERVQAADVVVVVTPEYNGTSPGLLVNALDWLSRPHRRSPLRGMPVLVLTAAPGRGGAGARAHAGAVLARLGARVSPHGFVLADAERALGDPALPGRLVAALAATRQEGSGLAA